MMKGRRFNTSLLVITLSFGILAGAAFTEKSKRYNASASREQMLAAIQTVRGAMDMIKSDMERAGYIETIPTDRIVAMRLSSPDPMELLKATPASLEFRVPGQAETIKYEMQGTKLVRSVGNRSLVLLQNARDFRVAATDGAVNVAFAIPVDQTTAPVYAHFVATDRHR